MKFKTVKDVYRLLEKTPKFQSTGAKAAKFDLERFERFCRAMGNPQESFPSIHVGGTNGKGSTCQILASIYHEAGFKTGLYTSPHLIDFKERFTIDGNRIPEGELLDFFQQNEELIKTFRLSYFEISTAVAFWWFSLKKVDLALIEVGLGGRLDATNIIQPALSVITNVSLDHTDILGETVRDIAREKAGIIKQDTPTVVGNIRPEARMEIESVASGRNSTVAGIDDLYPRWEEGRCFLTLDGAETMFQTDMSHPVQAYNIAVAWRVVSILNNRFPVDAEAFERGLKRVRQLHGHPGRFEKLHPGLEWYFDGAHNPDAVAAMVEAASRLKSPGEITLVLAIMEDKLNRSVANEFQKFKKIYYYELGSERAARMDDVKKWLPMARSISDQKAPKGLFLKELESELVIFAGSFYFYPTVREWLQSSNVVQ